MPGTAQTPETPADKDQANHLKEWEITRELMAFFDGKLHDIRKYGFTFVTALLTVEGIVLLQTKFAWSDASKLAAFGVTMLLIVALYLIDQNYKFYQRAANTRALVLERNLNLELSETITYRYRSKAINIRVLVLYLVFVWSVAALGVAGLYKDDSYVAGLIGIAVIATLLSVRIFRLGITYKHEYLEDWTIWPLECTQTDKLTITLTNLREQVKRQKIKWPQSRLDKTRKEDGTPKEGYPVWGKLPEPITFKKDELVWEMINEETGKSIEKRAKEDIVIYDSYIWILKESDFKEIGENGTYRLRPRGWPVPLNRRITVSDRDGCIPTVV